MAKTRRTERRFHHSLATAPIAESPSTGAGAEGISAVVELPKKVQQLVDEVKTAFNAFTSDFSLITSNRREFAPRFMRAFHQWETATKRSFIDFVRFMDPTVPVDRSDYRHHSSYQAAQYLQSLVEGHDSKPKILKGPQPVSPLQAMARLIGAFLPLVPDSDLIWAAFLKQLHWTEAQVQRLQKLVDSEKALRVMPVPKDSPRLRKAS